MLWEVCLKVCLNVAKFIFIDNNSVFHLLLVFRASVLQLPTVEIHILDAQKTHRISVLVSLLSKGQSKCCPLTVVVLNGCVLITFCLQPFSPSVHILDKTVLLLN